MKTVLVKKCKGFTLIELIAAMTITTILIIIIVALTTRGMELFKSTVDEVRTTNLARTALQAMSTDFDCMQYRRGNTYQWLFAERESLASKGGLKAGPKGLKMTNAAQLIFFTSAMDRNAAIKSEDKTTYQNTLGRRREMQGDVNAVAYSLQYRDQILDLEADGSYTSFPVFALYRHLIPAYRTYDELMGQYDLQQVYKRFVLDSTNPSNFLVENIIEMTVSFDVQYESKSSNSTSDKTKLPVQLVQQVPIMMAGSGSNAVDYSSLFIYGDKLIASKNSSEDSALKKGRVVRVSIALTVITDEGMTLVDQVRQGRKAPPLAEFFRRYTRSFVQQIELPSPL